MPFLKQNVEQIQEMRLQLVKVDPKIIAAPYSKIGRTNILYRVSRVDEGQWW